MKYLAVTLFTLVAVASARHITLEDVMDLEKSFAYGYLNRVGVPLADKIRKAKEEDGNRDASRIVGGSLATLGQFPYQAGLLMQLPSGSTAFASAVLVSPNRVLSAAHNFHDHVSSVTGVTVVLGSITVFTGGTRLIPTEIILHPNYIPAPPVNDIAMVNLPENVIFSSILAPIALPSGSQLDEDFAGDVAIASGFGKTADVGGVLPNQPLSYVHLPVISNDECARTFGVFLQTSNVCTNGNVGQNVCTGDSGGPLAVIRDGQPLLIGLTSFGLGLCEVGGPSAFARVTYYMDWVNERLL